MTIQSFKDLLKKQGKTIRQWALEHGFSPNAVYRTLNGVEKGHYGQSHDILVAAGIKRDEPQKLAA